MNEDLRKWRSLNKRVKRLL